MGAGRKTESYTSSEGTSGLPNNFGPNVTTHARNLSKSDLAGVIFGCQNHTISECLSKKLFGLPGAHICYVRNIRPGMPLFLFNYNTRMLHGIYEATSSGEMNINPYAWTENGEAITQFPAQVHIQLKLYCQPVEEKRYRPIIKKNYYTEKYIYFELDHSQVEGLMSLFKPVEQGGKAEKPRTMPPKVIPRPTARASHPAGVLKKCSEALVGLAGQNMYASLFWGDEDSECSMSSRASSTAVEDGENKAIEKFSSAEECEIKETVSDWEELCLDGTNSLPVVATHTLDEGSLKSFDNESGSHMQIDDEERKLNKLKKMASECSSIYPDGDSNGLVVSPAKKDVYVETHQDVSLKPTDFLFENSEMMQVLRELKEKTALLEKRQIDADRELQQLRSIVKDSDKKYKQLEGRIKEMQLTLDPSTVDESSKEAMVEQLIGSENCIYLCGGFDGKSWLNALDSYSPYLDELKSLSPMHVNRSYAGAASSNGFLYSFGGGNGDLWFDTVERYNRTNDEWIWCPSLSRKKGSLAGLTVNDKIFAIGGGNGRECFSDVEMFDPVIGRWLNIRSMLEKRFATGASELNGALYAVGGYDGNDYLNSAERLDLREPSWTRLPRMSIKRGSHSLAVFNEKLYALGGYDGDNMVPSTEVFDPRAGAWMAAEPINIARGYAAAAAVGKSLFILGGTTDEGPVDVVEYYKEGMGWKTTLRNAVGSRCFFSAIVL